MGDNVLGLLNKEWQECKIECTCDESQEMEAAPCPNTTVLNPFKHYTAVYPNCDECTLTIKESNAKIFEHRKRLLNQLICYWGNLNSVVSVVANP